MREGEVTLASKREDRNPEAVLNDCLPAATPAAAVAAHLGFSLLSISVNYIPLLVYAILIVKAGTVKQERQREIAHARRYGLQQTIILVPLMVVVVALFQEAGRRTKPV